MSITCLDCPSFLTKDDASEFFGITAGGPMCARYGWILGHNDEAAQKAIVHYASTCSSRGNTRPNAEIPSPTTFGSMYKGRADLLVATGESVSSCIDCVNFDEDAQACAAMGKVIFPERREIEAKECFCASPENTSSAFSHNKVDEVYEYLTGDFVAVSITSQPKAAPTPPKKRGPAKPPRAYDSDAPVSDEHKLAGVQAWRSVDTRQGPIFLPIFRTDYFGDRAELIPDPHQIGTSDPSLYIDHNGLLAKFAVITYHLDQNLMLTGEPGTGKTESMRYIAWMMNMPFERLPYNEASEPDQFLGLMQYGDTGEKDSEGNPILGTYFKPGLLPIAWQNPGVLLSDELNLPQEAIQQAYRSGLDSSRVLVVYDQKFRRHDYCFHVSAINPAHDFRNIGAKPMASADTTRWSFVHMPTPSDDMIRKVLNNTVQKLDGKTPDAFMISTIIKIGHDLRAMSREGRLPDFWTLRQEVKVARLIPFFGLIDAYATAYTNFVDEPTRELVESSIRSHMPSGTDWAE